jgi:tRNA-splicing ligase RtcB
MSRNLPPNVKAWLAEPLPQDVFRAVERVARAPDVVRVALMPDIHLANDVCVGTVIATRELIYPAAVGGDIGCGIAAVSIDGTEQLLRDARVAKELLEGLRSRVPAHRHHDRALPESLAGPVLSDARLQTVRRREGAVQFGTLGRGNHFLEYQADDEGRLWLMVHSGSRATGQAIRDFHISRATAAGGGLGYLRAGTPAGEAYIADAEWARAYARANRRAIIEAAAGALSQLTGAEAIPSTYLECDHNHVRHEEHLAGWFWVHRKGAMPAGPDEPGILPGSMGTESFHVAGRGNAEALCSSSHGAGRAMSRSEARQRVRATDVRRQMRGVWFDAESEGSLREEAPSAYKDVRAVLRAQTDLTRVVRRLRPLLVHKGA